MDETSITDELIEVNDSEIDLSPDSEDYKKVEALRQRDWQEEKWRPSGAWLYNGPNGLQKVKGTSDRPLDEAALLDLGLTEDAELQFVEAGWTMDVCQLCAVELFETEDELSGQGWRSEELWICDECYRLFVRPDSVFSAKFSA